MVYFFLIVMDSPEQKDNGDNVVDSQHSFSQIITMGKYSKYVSIPPGIVQLAEDVGREIILAEPWMKRVQRWATERWDPLGWFRADWKPLEWAEEPLWERQSFLVESSVLENGKIILVLTPTGLYKKQSRGRRKESG